MKKALILWATGLVWSGYASAEGEGAPAPAPASVKAHASKKPMKKKKASQIKVHAKGKKVSSVRRALPIPSRGLASAEAPVTVYSEKTNFESMVLEQQELGRRPAGFAGNARVISLRRELGLTRAEADAAPQDVVLNAGFKQGISEGMVLDVARKIPVLDPYKDNQQSELTVKFASIRVMHVEDEVAVARIEKMESIRSGLGVGVRGVLVGDYVGSTK